MKTSMRLVVGSLFAAALLGPAAAEILVGQTAGFSGPVAAGVKETSDGAKLYIDMINAKGGVRGETIKVISLDDQFDPKLAGENARKLIEEQHVVTMFLTRGTPHTQAIAPLLEKHKVPLIAPSTGAMVFHQPVNPYIFNVRATYQREAEKSIIHLATIGITRIAVIQVDDSFGADAMAGALKGFERSQLKPAVLEKFDRSKPNFAPIAQTVAQAQPQAILFIGSGNAVSDGTRALREAGVKAQVVTLSNNASGGFIKLLGEHARGTIVTQVFPYERSLSQPIVKEAFDLAKAKGMDEVTPAMLEGFAAAKVLVEALRRAGPKPTRGQILKALASIQNFDIGGLEVNYSATDHTGLDYADLSIIGPEGKFRR